jgi:hypothetical protein
LESRQQCVRKEIIGIKESGLRFKRIENLVGVRVSRIPAAPKNKIAFRYRLKWMAGERLFVSIKLDLLIGSNES